MHTHRETPIFNKLTSLLLFLGWYRLWRYWHSVGLLRDAIDVVQPHQWEQKAETFHNHRCRDVWYTKAWWQFHLGVTITKSGMNESTETHIVSFCIPEYIKWKHHHNPNYLNVLHYTVICHPLTLITQSFSRFYTLNASSTDNQPGPSLQLSAMLHPTSHNRDPEYCLLPEEQNPASPPPKKKTTNYSILYIFGPPDTKGFPPPCHGVFGEPYLYHYWMHNGEFL